MATRQGEQLVACTSRTEQLCSPHGGRSLTTCLRVGGTRRGVSFKASALRGRFLSSSVLLLMAPTPMHLFFCFYVTLGDFCAGDTASVQQRGQHVSLRGENPLELARQKQSRWSGTIVTALQAASPYGLRRSAGRNAATAAGWTLPLVALTPGAAMQAVVSATRGEFPIVAVSDPPATAEPAQRTAEHSSVPSSAAGTEARRLGGAEQVGEVTRTNLPRSSKTVPLSVAAAEESESSEEGGAHLQTTAVQAGSIARTSQRQRKSKLLQKRSNGAVPRVGRKTGASVAKEATGIQITPVDPQELQAKFDEIFADVVLYGQLRRQRDFDKVEERYADEDEIPMEGLTILDRARSDLTKLRDRKSMWITVMMCATFIFAAAAFWLFQLLNYAPSHPLSATERQQRQSELRTSTATALFALLLTLFGNWRRTELNDQIYYQELEADRIAFESLAGVRPTKKNLLGPSKKEIKEYRRALEKKMKAAKDEKAEQRERRRMRRWWEGA